MSLRINTNLTSLALQQAMQKSEKEIFKASKNLSTGSRLSQAANDSAGSAISSKLQSEIQAQESAQRNAEIAEGFASTAEGALSEQAELVARMRELAVQAASDTYTDRERDFIQNEFENLQQETQRIAEITTYGSNRLLDGSTSRLEIQVGTDGRSSSQISFDAKADTTLSGLSLQGSSVSSKSEARDTIDELVEAQDKLSNIRSKFGAFQSRLSSAVNLIASSKISNQEAKSKVSDADVAFEVSNLRRNQVLQQYQTTLLQQSNDNVGIALKLIG